MVSFISSFRRPWFKCIAKFIDTTGRRLTLRKIKSDDIRLDNCNIIQFFRKTHIQVYDLVEVEEYEEIMGSLENAKILSGREVSKKIQQQLTEEVKSIKAKYPEFNPTLAIVQVGGREDSNVYIRMKTKAAAQVGVTAQHIKFPRTITEKELIEELNKLNDDPAINGIIVQLPLDCDNPIDANLITNTINPDKDVDGIHDVNAGKLAHGQLEGFFVACTPCGCLELIKESGIEIKGSRAVVLGRSKIVGMPMAQLLIWNHATVTICHSRTKDLPSVVREADILVVAIGRAQMVKGDWIKPGAVVIDCGINSIPDSTKASGSRLVGDVDFEEAKSVASFITPVPGGVGPMTVAMLIKNSVEAGKRALEKKLGSKI